MSALGDMTGFMAGLQTAGYVIAAGFFLKFWRRTGDSLFATFAAAFMLMGANQAIPVIFGIAREDQSGVYLLRLAAFALIIAAILRKNMQGRS